MIDTRLSSRGMGELLDSQGIGDMLEDLMQAALDAARSAAPVDTGAYRDGLHLVREHTDRVVVRLVADVDYALAVEADTGNLARALDAV